MIGPELQSGCIGRAEVFTADNGRHEQDSVDDLGAAVS